MFRNLGALSPFWGGGVGSLSNTKSPGPRPTSIPSGILINPAIWPQHMGRKLGGLCPFGERELGPHLTQCGQGRGLPVCQVSSCSIQPFGHSTPSSQTGQTGQRTDSIRRTVLQTVAQKSIWRQGSSRASNTERWTDALLPNRLCRHSPLYVWHSSTTSEYFAALPFYGHFPGEPGLVLVHYSEGPLFQRLGLALGLVGLGLVNLWNSAPLE